MLDPRAIATLGIGYGASLVARIGLWPAVPAPTFSGGGGGGYPQRDAKKPRNDDDELLIMVLL